MAEQTTSESSPDTDRDFDPSADMLVDDFDDERTMEEEEALSNEDSVGRELDDLQKESEMPIEELLAAYRQAASSPEQPQCDLHESRSSSEEEILSNQDLTLDKEQIGRDLLTNVDEDGPTSADELLDSVSMEIHSDMERMLRSNNRGNGSEDDSDDEDYEPEHDDSWKKTIQVGSDYQAVVPHGLSKYGDAPAYENEDRLLWDPYKLESSKVDTYLKEVKLQNDHKNQGLQMVPTGTHIRDDEQALYLLLQCAHNVEEALRRRKMQAVPPSDPMSLWSEEECRNFENGLRTYGKDFFLIQLNKVRTRSVGELVQFYYLWKKTERHDVFANKTRLEKKKYTLHPGVTDYMDRFLDEQENPAPMVRDRSSSPSINSLIYGDPKRHAHNELKAAVASEDLAVALDIMQKVIDPETLTFPSKVATTEVAGVETADPVPPSSRSKRLHPPQDSADPPPGNFHPISSSEKTVSDSVVCVSPKPTTKAPVSTAETCPIAKSDGDALSSEPCAKRAKLSTDGVCASASTTTTTSCSTAVSQMSHCCDSPAASATSVVSVSSSSSTKPVMNGPTTTETPATTSASHAKPQETQSVTVTSTHTVNGGDHVGGVALSLANVSSTTTAVKLLKDVNISSMPSKSPVSMSTTAQAVPAANSLVQ